MVKMLNWKVSPGVSYAEYCGHSRIFTPRRATNGDMPPSPETRTLLCFDASGKVRESGWSE